MFKLALFGVMITILYGLIKQFLLLNNRGDFGGGDDEGESESKITAQGTTITQAGGTLPEEKESYLGAIRGTKDIENIARYLLGLGTAPEGYLGAEGQLQRGGGELGKLLYSQISEELKDPYKYYESTLQPQLQLAMDEINRGAQQRGLIRSGIPLEAGSRAAVELAIKEAQARQQARSNALARGGSLLEYGQGLESQNIGRLAGLYGQQQQLGQQSMARGLSAATAAAPYFTYPYQYQMGQSGGSYGGLGAGLGMLGGALLAAPTGGMSIPMGAIIGGSLGAGAGGMIRR